MTNDSPAHRIALYVLLFLTLLALTPRAGFTYDVNYWVAWAQYGFTHGLGQVYQDPTNQYNPVYHYLLFAYARLAGRPEKIEHYRNLIKGFVLLFDFAGAIVASSIVPERGRRLALSFLLLLNIGYLYNTLIWQQIDAIFSCLAFAAVVLALRGRGAWSAALFMLALLAKAQAILFLPPLLLLWAPGWVIQPRTLATAAVAGLGTLAMVLAPFTWLATHNDLDRIIRINFDPSIGLQEAISMNACNLWALLPGVAMMSTDTAPYGGMTYRTWGLLLFLLLSALVLMPLLLLAVRRMQAGRRRAAAVGWAPTQYATILLICGLLPLISTFLNTRMHERYWHSSLLFLAAYGFLTRRYGPLALLSVAYFLNMETMLQFMGLYNYHVLIFDMRFIAGLFAVLLVWCLLHLYRRVRVEGGEHEAALLP